MTALRHAWTSEAAPGRFGPRFHETVGDMDSVVLTMVRERVAGARRHRARTGRPLVTLTYAQSLDGSIASLNRRPLALSSFPSLALTHAMRALHRVILVGIGCVLADNPRLTVRLVPGENPQPVVVDSRLRLPLSSRLVADGGLPPWVMTGLQADPAREEVLESAGARVTRLPSGGREGLDLSRLLSELARRGVDTVMVEGGGRIITSFLSRRLVDQVVITIAPLLVGGLRGVGRPLREFPRLRNLVYQKSEEDLVLWGEPERA